MPETTRLPRIRPEKKPPVRPEWAAVIEKFYADSFDARSQDALLESAEAFADMEPEEQAFHQAHLAFRQVQALADIHATLQGIERGLAALDPKALAALKHLPGVRKALVVIARGQQEMLDIMESGPAGGGVVGDEDDEGDEGAHDEAADEDDEPSELADAADYDDAEEEDHGNGDVEVVVPEVIPAGARRAAADAPEPS
jgi:hypothetical protein